MVWDNTVTELAGCYRIHTIQIRGFGDDAGINATGPVLEGFTNELADYIDDEITYKGRTKPVIIGHSMGGLSALMVSARHPNLVNKVIVVDSLPFIGLLYSPAATLETVKHQAIIMRDNNLALGKQPIDKDMLEIISATPAGRAVITKWWDSADNRVTMQLYYDLMTTDIRPELSSITAPFTLIYPYDTVLGSSETITSLYTAAYNGPSGMQIKRIDNSRHFIMLDQPEKFAAAIAEFLQD